MERIYFEEFDDKIDFNFYENGSSPKLLETLLKFLDECNPKKIFIAFYLLNNKYLYRKLLELAKTGVKVNIISIPLEGYDDSKPKKLFDSENSTYSNKAYTKLSLAEEIYNDYLNNRHPNINFYIFPHICVRSKYMKKFSRGTLPYSLHIKSMLIEANNCSYSVQSSSNFACRDIKKFENLYIKETGSINSAHEFFQNLIQNSIKLEDFDNTQSYEYNYHINISESNQRLVEDHSFFSAPFYKDSNSEIENLIINKINHASDLIVICAQHLAAFEYNYYDNGQSNSRNGILYHALNNSKAKKVFFSQTYFDPGINMDGIRKPVNTEQFQKFAFALKGNPDVAYRVNSNIHSKFIIADNDIYITSANFTPTQFIYLEDVRIDQFEFDNSISYRGIHSEVAHFEHTTNPSVRQALLNHCKFIDTHQGTYKVKRISK